MLYICTVRKRKYIIAVKKSVEGNSEFRRAIASCIKESRPLILGKYAKQPLKYADSESALRLGDL